jgi:hypothetical protein
LHAWHVDELGCYHVSEKGLGVCHEPKEGLYEPKGH